MKRTLCLVAAILLIVPACIVVKCPQPRDTSMSAEAGVPRKPPPTKIKFFNHSGKQARIKRSVDLQFRVVDATGATDVYGVDDKYFQVDLAVPCFPDPACTGERPIREPTHRENDRSPDINVSGDYRTIGFTVTATVENRPGTVEFNVPTPDGLDDIKYPVLLVAFMPAPNDPAQTLMQVSTKYWDGTAYIDILRETTIAP